MLLLKRLTQRLRRWLTQSLWRRLAGRQESGPLQRSRQQRRSARRLIQSASCCSRRGSRARPSCRTHPFMAVLSGGDLADWLRRAAVGAGGSGGGWPAAAAIRVAHSSMALLRSVRLRSACRRFACGAVGSLHERGGGSEMV